MALRPNTPGSSRRGATSIEYVILVILIGIGVTFAVLLFGKAAQNKIDDASQVLAGNIEANRLASPPGNPSEADAGNASQGLGASSGGGKTGGGGRGGSGSGEAGGSAANASAPSAGGGGGSSSAGGQRQLASAVGASDGGRTAGGSFGEGSLSGGGAHGEGLQAGGKARSYTVERRSGIGSYQFFIILLIAFVGVMALALTVSMLKKRD
jgi:Flp pilus assembly pilin Flp